MEREKWKAEVQVTKEISFKLFWFLPALVMMIVSIDALLINNYTTKSL